MKLLHLADLHLGKRVNGFSLLEDQQFILARLAELVEQQQVDAVLIAGDIYDKSIPSVEAVELFDAFLTQLQSMEKQVFAVSGNHDSPGRLHYGGRIFARNGVYIAGRPEKSILCVPLRADGLRVNICLLPFLRPAQAQALFGKPAETYDQAVRAALATVRLNQSDCNLLLAHQFVVNGGLEPERCDSETLFVGGIDHVDVSAFDAFDYVALGHLHGPQQIGRPTVRYAGSPLKYSFSEAAHHKSATLLTIESKQSIQIETLPVQPLRDMRRIKGPIDRLCEQAVAARANAEDYLHVTLTDEEAYDAIGRLRAVYPNIMRLEFDNSRTRAPRPAAAVEESILHQAPEQLFETFYTQRCGAPMSREQKTYIKKLFDELREQI